MKQSLLWFCVLFFLCIHPGYLPAQAIDSTDFTLDSPMLGKPIGESTEDQKPYWVREMKIEDPEQCYFGIGMSEKSREDADDKARIEFAKMLEVQVDAQVQHQISEKGRKVSEAFQMKNTVMSKMILRGIYVSERWTDPETGKYYSLIRVNKGDYNKLIEEEVALEAARQIALNRYEEKKREETIRHQESMVKLDSAQTAVKLTEKKHKDEKREARKKRQKEHMEHIARVYGKYNTFQPHSSLADMKNAEIDPGRHSLSVKGALNRPGFVSASYSVSMFRFLNVSLTMGMHRNRLDRQDATVKFKILDGIGKIYRMSAAISFSQYLSTLPRIQDFNGLKDNSFHHEFTFGGMVNVSIPNLYSTACLQADKRRVSLGWIIHPLYMHLEEHLGVFVQVDYFPQPFFRNPYGDKWQLQPGVQFMVIPERLYTTLAYEDNHLFNLNLDIHF